MADIALETFEIDLTEPLDDNVVKDFESYNSKNPIVQHALLNGSNLNQSALSSTAIQQSPVNVINLNGIQQQPQHQINLQDSTNHANVNKNQNANKVNLAIPLILPNNQQPQQQTTTVAKNGVFATQVDLLTLIVCLIVNRASRPIESNFLFFSEQLRVLNFQH
jgi:hypothetical protein